MIELLDLMVHTLCKAALLLGQLLFGLKQLLLIIILFLAYKAEVTKLDLDFMKITGRGTTEVLAQALLKQMQMNGLTLF